VFAAGFDQRDPGILDVVAHLGRHGIEVTVDGWEDTGEAGAIDAMFASLEREESDLIVAGAYGHSPLREYFLGSTSEQLLNNVSMPLIMSH
jgi:nucleotide-binding universal stress UspA family protein